MRLRNGVGACLVFLTMGACGSGPDRASRPVTETPDALAARVTALADTTAATMLAVQPEIGTRLGLTDAEHGRLDDNSPEGIRAAHARWDALYADVVAVDPAPLRGRPEWILYGVMREQLEAERGMRVCREELWGVASYVNGWQARFTDLAIIQPVGSDKARGMALDRARAVAPWLEREIANLRQGLAAGYSSPKVIVRNVIRQVDDLLATPVASSPFYSPAQRDTTPAFGADLAGIIEREIHPAMRRYRDFLAQEYLDRAREALGVTANPDGAACYAAAIRNFATVAVTPDEVFAMGIREMARIEGEMRAISTRSFGGEPLATLLPRLRTDPRYTHRTSQEIMDASEAVLARARREMGTWFGRLPKAQMIIQPYPEFRQRAGAPGQYQPAPEDGSRPAIFLINPSDPTRQPRADIETTALHEGIPGHHLQVAIANERTSAHPLIRYTFSSGFGEGWALYAERLGDEMGLLSSDVARMGMLGSEAFRAARLVIDAGVHSKGWSRERALDYLTSHSFVTGSTAEGEIDRYISWPGQAPSYMIGRNEILRLRERARAALGPRFDIRAFHDRVLENGTVPLGFLGTVVDGWVADQSRQAGSASVSPR